MLIVTINLLIFIFNIYTFYLVFGVLSFFCGARGLSAIYSTHSNKPSQLSTIDIFCRFMDCESNLRCNIFTSGYYISLRNYKVISHVSICTSQCA